jgi:CBS domain containing-hemolysin-like protein
MPHDVDAMLIVIVVGVSLLTSFFCSMLEASLFSISRSQIETLRRRKDPRGDLLAQLRNRMDESIVTILIVNTIANTLGAAWAGALVQTRYGNTWLGLFSAGFTGAVLFFGEIVPKSLGVRFAPILAPTLALPLRAMVWCLTPLSKLCVLLTRFWQKSAGGASHGTVEDIISLAHLVQHQGEIEEREASWVANVLQLDDVTAGDLMTPSPVVARVPGVMKTGQTTLDADHWRFSRLPVCADEDPDRILGVVHRRKVFDALARDRFDLTIAELMEPPVFVEEGVNAHELLERFLNTRRHLFCVTNHEGHFVGVVTLEDVLECLLGEEIVDETDLHEDMQAVARQRKRALLSRRRSGGGTTNGGTR